MIEAKTLRALAKNAGYKPSSIFRMQPSEILEMLTEKYPDIKEWSEDKAQKAVAESASNAVTSVLDTEEEEKAVEKQPVKEEKKAKTKTPVKKKPEVKEAEEVEEPEEVNTVPAEETPEPRDMVTRQRKKKSPVLPQSVGGVSSEEIDVLRELVTTLQEDVTRLTRMVDDVSMFLTWFHNVKVDPREPIEHLGAIDWAACIDDQVK